MGISEKAVRKARDAGRLDGCIGADGKIDDFERARIAFSNSSRTGVGAMRTSGPQAHDGPQSAPVAPPSETVAGAEPSDAVSGQLVFATTLIDAQKLATNERARKLKMENDVTEGRLVPIDQIKKEAFEAERIVRENILNIPPRIAGALAAETDPQRVLRLLEAEMYRGLNAAADALSAVNE